MKSMRRFGLFLFSLVFFLALGSAAEAASLPILQTFNTFPGGGWTGHNPYLWEGVEYENNDTDSRIGFFPYTGADGYVLCFGSSGANKSTDVSFYWD